MNRWRRAIGRSWLCVPLLLVGVAAAANAAGLVLRDGKIVTADRAFSIRAYTNWPAYAAFLDDVLGSLEIGKYADIVVLDKDLTSVPPQEILQARVRYTILGGRIVFEE